MDGRALLMRNWILFWGSFIIVVIIITEIIQRIKGVGTGRFRCTFCKYKDVSDDGRDFICIKTGDIITKESKKGLLSESCVFIKKNEEVE